MLKRFWRLRAFYYGGVAAAMLMACGTIGERDMAPVANAGFDMRVRVGDAVELDGSASAGAPELAFTWRMLAKPVGSTASLNDPESANPRFIADREGDYLIQLEVLAEGQRSAPDVVAVSARNRPPVALAACGISTCRVLHGRTAGLVSTSYDPDGEAITHLWEQVLQDCPAHCPALANCDPYPETVTLANATHSNASFVAPQARDVNVVFKLAVNDGSASATACVVYEVYNSPPVALFLPYAAGPPPRNPNTPIASGSTFLLAVMAEADADGDPLTFLWEQIHVDEPDNIDTPGNIASPGSSQTLVTAPVLDGGPVQVTYRITVSDGVDQDSAELVVQVE